jgi:hypothetical protein
MPEPSSKILFAPTLGLIVQNQIRYFITTLANKSFFIEHFKKQLV